MKNVLDEFLKEKGIDNTTFAMRLRVTPASVGFWRKQQGCPRAPTAKRIEKVTKGEVPVSFWGYEKDMKGNLYRARPFVSRKDGVSSRTNG